MIHTVEKNPTYGTATQISQSTTHKYFRKAAHILVHISCQILKRGSQYSSNQSLKREDESCYKQNDMRLTYVHDEKNWGVRYRTV